MIWTRTLNSPLTEIESGDQQEEEVKAQKPDCEEAARPLEHDIIGGTQSDKDNPLTCH